VTVTGASYRGVGLPDCITQAHGAAARVRTWLGGEAIDGEGALDRPEAIPA
jgi:hypothetical protein